MINEALLERIRNNTYTGTEDNPDDGKLVIDISEEGDIESVTDALKTNTHIHNLGIAVVAPNTGAYYTPTEREIELLSHLNVRTLVLYAFSIKDKGHILARNDKIVELHVSCCFVEDKDIYDIIRNNHSIKALSMDGNRIGSEGLAALQFNDTLEEVWIGEQFQVTETFAWPKPLGPKVVPYFMGMKSLTSLNLRKNAVGEEGAKLLATHPSLKKLNLSENGIGSIGAAAFANNSVLEVLDLSKNLIFSEGLLNYNNEQGLVELKLRDNPVNDDAAEALRSMTKLRKLDMAESQITHKFTEHFKESPVYVNTEGTVASVPKHQMLKSFEMKKQEDAEKRKQEEAGKSSKMKFSVLGVVGDN